jgi:AcrR family transcriptional regulator
LPPEDRRRQILSAASQLLDTRQLEDITVEEAAGQAGVSPGLLFHYFGTQRKFRRELAEAAARELLDQIEPDPELSPAQQLHMALDTFAASVAKRPGIYLAATRISGGNQDLSELRAGIRGTLPRMTHQEVVELCESACYQLVRTATADPDRWRAVEEAFAKVPSERTATE